MFRLRVPGANLHTIKHKILWTVGAVMQQLRLVVIAQPYALCHHQCIPPPSKEDYSVWPHSHSPCVYKMLHKEWLLRDSASFTIHIHAEWRPPTADAKRKVLCFSNRLLAVRTSCTARYTHRLLDGKIEHCLLQQLPAHVSMSLWNVSCVNV